VRTCAEMMKSLYANHEVRMLFPLGWFQPINKLESGATTFDRYSTLRPRGRLVYFLAASCASAVIFLCLSREVTRLATRVLGLLELSHWAFAHLRLARGVLVGYLCFFVTVANDPCWAFAPVTAPLSRDQSRRRLAVCARVFDFV